MKEPDFVTGMSDGSPTEEDFKNAFNAMKEAVTETASTENPSIRLRPSEFLTSVEGKRNGWIKQRCTVCGNGDTTLRNQSYLLHGEIVSGRICTDCYKKYTPTPIMVID